MTDTAPHPTPPRLLIGALRTFLGSAVYAALAFLGAGKVDWPRGWTFAAVFVAVSVVGATTARWTDPAVMDARSKGFRKNTKSFDRRFFALFIPLVVITPVLAGLDAVRFGWAPLPLWTAALGVLLFVAGSALSTWTLLVNPHAESTVRVQTDRGHAVVSRGPYRLVRHPMYLGTLIGQPGAALILGSAWTLVPAFLVVALFVWRTGREDRALTDELPGYADYARTTRFRLLPGVW